MCKKDYTGVPVAFSMEKNPLTWKILHPHGHIVGGVGDNYEVCNSGAQLYPAELFWNCFIFLGKDIFKYFKEKIFWNSLKKRYFEEKIFWNILKKRYFDFCRVVPER